MAVDIPLTRGFKAVVDAADAAILLQYTWRSFTHKAASGKAYCYACRSGDEGEPRTVFMHRQIMQAPAGFDVDHFDNNGLNNQRSNLRILTRGANAIRGLAHSENKSGFSGVHLINGLWYGRARKDGRTHNTASYSTPDEAYEARNRLLFELYGAHVFLNSDVSIGSADFEDAPINVPRDLEVLPKSASWTKAKKAFYHGELVASYASGEPIWSLAKRLPMSPQSIWNYLNRHGVALRS